MARANPFRFSTKYQDDETDLLYYGYRYYNANNGRWLSRDPIRDIGFWRLPRPATVESRTTLDEDGGEGEETADARHYRWSRDINAYGFILNSPGNDVDGLGLFALKDKLVIVGACEIVYLFGHQDSGRPWVFKFDPKAVGVAFNGCWPDLTNKKVASGYLIPGAPLHHKKEHILPPDYVPGVGPFEERNRPLYDEIQEDSDKDWRRWHEAIQAGINSIARTVCKARCCKEITIYEINTPTKLRFTPKNEKWIWSCP